MALDVGFVDGLGQEFLRLAPVASFEMPLAFDAIEAAFQAPRADLRCGPGGQLERPAKRGVEGTMGALNGTDLRLVTQLNRRTRA